MENTYLDHEKALQAAAVDSREDRLLALNEQYIFAHDQAQKFERRFKTYRFLTGILACVLLISLVLTQAFKVELEAATVQLKTANDRLRADRAQFDKDLESLASCRQAQMILEGARIGAGVPQ